MFHTVADGFRLHQLRGIGQLVQCGGIQIGLRKVLKNFSVCAFVSLMHFHGAAEDILLIRASKRFDSSHAIPITTKNPERAVMLYSKLMLDQRYNRLAQYGIEGKHYTIDEDGYYVQIKDSGFDPGSMRPWAYNNKSLGIPTKAGDLQNALIEERHLKDIAYVNISSSFNEDSSAYTAERAALMNVISEYLVPIQAGFVDDVDEAIDEFLKQARAAGLEKIQQEYSAQWLKYVEDNHIVPTKIEY